MVAEELMRDALKLIACNHSYEDGRTAMSGGNDYIMCWKCGLEWAYGKRAQPTAQEIAANALSGKSLNEYNMMR